MAFPIEDRGLTLRLFVSEADARSFPGSCEPMRYAGGWIAKNDAGRWIDGAGVLPGNWRPDPGKLECITDKVSEAMKPDEFTVGQVVMWTSQAAGYTKTKSGVIEAIIEAGALPDRNQFLQLFKGPGVGGSRDHRSYVVRVKGKTDRSAGKLYWPRVSALVAGKTSP